MIEIKDYQENKRFQHHFDVIRANAPVSYGGLKLYEGKRNYLMQSPKEFAATLCYLEEYFVNKKVNQLASPLTRVKNISILEYRTPSTLDSWLPNTFVDITDYFEEKYNRLMEFISQNQRWYFKKELLKSFHSNFQSYKKGIKYTEKFKTVQLYKL